MEAAAAVKGRKLAEMTLEEMDAIWNSVKKANKIFDKNFPTIGIPARVPVYYSGMAVYSIFSFHQLFFC